MKTQDGDTKIVERACSDESEQRQGERDAALWWRFYYEDERPFFIPPSVKPLRAETEKHWVSQMWLGQTAFERGSFCEAEQHFREAVLEAEKLGNDSQLATTLRCLGRSLCAQDRHEESEPLYKRALELHDHLACPSTLELAEDFDAFVAHYRMQGRYSEAEELLQEALDRFEKLENNSPLIARYLNNLAVLRCEEGRCDEAEAIYRRVLELTKTFTGERVNAYAVTLLNLAVLCYKNGRDAEARELYQHAAKILQMLPDPARQLKMLDDYQKMFGGREKISKRKIAPSPYLHTSIPEEKRFNEHVD